VRLFMFESPCGSQCPRAVAIQWPRKKEKEKEGQGRERESVTMPKHIGKLVYYYKNMQLFVAICSSISSAICSHFLINFIERCLWSVNYGDEKLLRRSIRRM
jgi:hypothetical protein